MTTSESTDILGIERAETGLRDDLVHQLREGLSVRPEVELVEPGSLPRSERKTQRVFDHRSN